MEQKEKIKRIKILNLGKSPKSTYVTSGQNVTSQPSGQSSSRSPPCEALTLSTASIPLSWHPKGLPRAAALLKALFDPFPPAQVACSGDQETLGSLLFDLPILEGSAVIPFTIPSNNDHGPFISDEHLDDANS